MIKSKDVVNLLVFLILNCYSRQGVLVFGANTHEQTNLGAQQSGQDLSLLQQQKHQSQPQPQLITQLQELSYGSSPRNNQDNPRRYIMKVELDLDGNMARSIGEQFRMIRLNALLDSLSSSIPTPGPIIEQTSAAPVFRRGQNPQRGISASDEAASLLLSSMRGRNQQAPQQLGLEYIPSISSLAQQQKNFYALNDIDSSSPRTLRQYQYFSWPKSEIAQRRLFKVPSGFTHRSGTAEIPLHTPMHPRSLNDFEFKRVENSRWNNLRGMWGKRASGVSEINNNFIDNQQQTQQNGDGDGVGDRAGEVAALIGDSGQHQIIDTKSM